MMGIKLSTYQAYEEGRCWPPVYALIRLADVYGIKDLMAFLTSSGGYQHVEPDKEPDPIPPTLLERMYQEAGIKEKLAVNILLGLVDLE